MSIDCLAHYRDDGTGYKWNKLDNLIPMHDMIDGHLDTPIDGDDELNFNQVTHCLLTLHSGPLPVDTALWLTGCRHCTLAHCLSN